MTAEEAAEAAKGLNFEKIWLMIQETDRQIRELSREAERWQEDTYKQIQELSKNIDGLNDSSDESTSSP
jgi:uncharacterized protein Yka (UPF0111/DUF47 family)